MSQPTFPEVPDFERDDVINQILASIALEELGLSHIINAEGEKIQFVLGTLKDSDNKGDHMASIEDVLKVNESVRDTLDTISDLQLILKSKMRSALEEPEQRPHPEDLV